MMELQRLAGMADRLAVQDAVLAFFDALDKRDWAAAEIWLHPNLEFISPMASANSADAFIAAARQAAQQAEGSQHFITNLRVTLENEEAGVECLMIAMRTQAKEVRQIMSARYRMGARREADRWLLCRLAAEPAWIIAR